MTPPHRTPSASGAGGATDALVVFAKEPVPGRVKTRLVPPFSPQQAAEFYAAMLDDVLDSSASLARELGIGAWLAVDPPGALRALARRAPTGFRVVPQRGANLGERMGWAVREAFASGARRVLIRGSDSPAVDGEKIRSALTALSESDLVVSPDLDGGYNLVGLRVPAPGLFDHPMSTRTVLEDTLANARAAGLRCDLQEPAFDIDTAEDLVHLARARRGPNRTEITKLCSRTLAYLDERALWPDPRWA